jgi:hypothetical protein
MTDRVRIIPHEAIPGCGSFEVGFQASPASISIGTIFHPAGLPLICWIVRPRWIGQGPLRVGGKHNVL